MPAPYTTQAVIAYDNVFTAGTLTASSDQEGGEKENAVDGFTYDFWEPLDAGSPPQHWLRTALATPQAVDYLAIAAHNFATLGADITLQSSANGSDWSTVAGPFFPAESKPYLWRFTAVTAAYFRVLVQGDGILLGVLQAGSALVLPEGVFVGHSPATLNRRPKILNAESEGGQLLGRSRIRSGAAAEIKQERVSQAWARETWDPFAEHAETRPFFFAWRHDDYPQEVLYGWSDGGATVQQGSNGFMSVSLDIVGQVE